MPGPVSTTSFYDMLLEDHALRRAGLLGSGANANQLFAISYYSLPPEAHATLRLIASNGPFPYPGHDGTAFLNRFGDLPSGEYLEYTVPTPGVSHRGARRIVARKTSGVLFFTACHYDRVSATGGTPAERKAAQERAVAAIDEQWRNGFYVITGTPPGLYSSIQSAIKAAHP